MGWSWFYECEFQLFIMTPWIVILYNKLGRKVCYALFTLPIALGVYINYDSSYVHKITVGIFSIENFFMYSYFINKPYYKLHVYFFGIICSMFFIDIRDYKKSKRDKNDDYKEFSTVNFMHRSASKINGSLIKRFFPIFMCAMSLVVYYEDAFLPFPRMIDPYSWSPS